MTRFQRKRTKGYKLPPNTVSVARPGNLGNPFVVGKGAPEVFWEMFGFENWYEKPPYLEYEDYRRFIQNYENIPDKETACRLFRQYLDWLSDKHPERLESLLSPIRNKNVACFCHDDEKFCHADILLEYANK